MRQSNKIRIIVNAELPFPSISTSGSNFIILILPCLCLYISGIFPFKTSLIYILNASLSTLEVTDISSYLVNIENPSPPSLIYLSNDNV